MRKFIRNSQVVLLLAAFLFSCQQQPGTTQDKEHVVVTQVEHPEWAEDAVIYEANIRQHTAEGTFDALAEDLPRLKEMGIDILWLMPVFPIGQVNRKASQTVLVEEIEDPAEREKILGSYYAIRDYRSVNPEFGTIDDFEDLVKEAHALGMYVILDIAVNHTAWDHPWIAEHPDFYTRIDPDSLPWNPEWMTGHPEYFERIAKLEMTYPINPKEEDWWDTAELNFDNPELRRELIEVFKYWVDEFDIDGYRCDVAWGVPCDFWNQVRPALDSIKSVFMLAEDEHTYCIMEKAFDMNYTWEFHHITNEIARGDKTVDDLEAYFTRHDSIWDPAIYRMNFITNHDENSWAGTVFERYGEAVEVYAFLTFVVPGMPLIYSGQEAGLDKRLRFFEKDTVDWSDLSWEAVYTDFIAMKKENEVFRNGETGGDMKVIGLTDAESVFAFERSTEDSRVVILANLGKKKASVQLDERYQEREWVEYFSQDEVDAADKIEVKGYGYKMLIEE